MRIGLVLLNSEIGGTEKRFASLFSYLSKQSSHSYHLLVPEGLFQALINRGLLQANQSNVVRVFNRGLYRLYNRLPLKFRGRRIQGLTRLLGPLWNSDLRSDRVQSFFEQSDVVHYALATPHLLAGLRFDRPTVIEAQDAGIKGLQNAFIEQGWHSGALFDFASERIRTGYEALTNRHDPNRFFSSPCSFVDYTKTYTAPKEKLITFLGRFMRIKNPELFVEAIALLAVKRRDFKACLLGDKQAAMDRLIERKGLRDLIECRYDPEPQKTLSRSLIFVSLQADDNYHSQALMEAMAAGCAIVASDVGETSRLVSDEVGFRVPLDAKTIADRLDRMLSAFDESVKQGQAARTKVMSEQTITRYADFIENLYEKALTHVRNLRNRDSH